MKIWRETNPEGTAGAKAPIKGMLDMSKNSKIAWWGGSWISKKEIEKKMESDREYIVVHGKESR